MKTIRITAWTLVCVLLLGTVSGCGQKKNKVDEEVVEEIVEEAPVETCITAVDRYLVDSIGKFYSPAEICIPGHNYIAVDETNADDILVWGDFWVMNYNQAGDTLKSVSGGNHPGLMHVRKIDDNHFEVVSFDGVEAGTGNDPSARRIFGDKYPEYQAAHSDDKKREATILEAIAEYVQNNGLAVTMCQDYGWPAVELPIE